MKPLARYTKHVRYELDPCYHGRTAMYKWLSEGTVYHYKLVTELVTKLITELVTKLITKLVTQLVTKLVTQSALHGDL